MSYVVVGPTIVNDITFADGSEKKAVLGGSVFCLAGIGLWDSDCVYVSNVGPDFGRYYGPWMQANGFTLKGLSVSLPHTWYTHLLYGAEGLHSEVSIYGEADEKELERLDVITGEQVAASCGADTRGIYIEASESAVFWRQADAVRRACGAKILWEPPTSAFMMPSRRAGVLETLQKVDLYSLNGPEARSFFEAGTDERVIRAILALGKPCFYHVGKRGSYMIQDGAAHFAPSVTVGPVVDATGCGNAASAAALYGWCEGFPPEKTARLANLSAAWNLLQYGPFPAVTPDVRETARKLLER